MSPSSNHWLPRTGVYSRQIPLTIDASYVVGFNYTRNWQLRAVKDFGPTVSLGVSIAAVLTAVTFSAARAAQLF